PVAGKALAQLVPDAPAVLVDQGEQVRGIFLRRAAEERGKGEAGDRHDDQGSDREENEADSVAGEQAQILDDRREQRTGDHRAGSSRTSPSRSSWPVRRKNTSARSGRWSSKVMISPPSARARSRRVGTIATSSTSRTTSPSLADVARARAAAP